MALLSYAPSTNYHGDWKDYVNLKDGKSGSANKHTSRNTYFSNVVVTFSSIIKDEKKCKGLKRCLKSKKTSGFLNAYQVKPKNCTLDSLIKNTIRMDWDTM